MFDGKGWRVYSSALFALLNISTEISK